jgi:hypothetical protein
VSRPDETNADSDHSHEEWSLSAFGCGGLD